MNNFTPHSEKDPAIESAQAIEREYQAENQKRLEINRMMAENKVPTYDQLVAARDWVTDVRDHGSFDADDKLVQESGLVPVDQQMLQEVAAYFDTGNWMLGKKELEMASSIWYGNINNGKQLSTLEIIDKFSPELAEKVNGQLEGLSTLARLDKIGVIKSDTLARIRLDSAIRSQRRENGLPEFKTATDDNAERADQKAQQDNETVNIESERLAEAGLLGIDIELALSEIEKAAAEGRNIDFVDGTVLGLSMKQREKLLEYYRLKPVDTPAPLDPRTLVRETSSSERLRRLFNGSHKKTKVAARQKIEAKANRAQAQLDADAALPAGHRLKLSERERAKLKTRAQDPESKIGKGSRHNPEKYGSAVTNESLRKKRAIYTTQNIKAALEQLKREREGTTLEREDIKLESQRGAYDLLEKAFEHSINRTSTETVSDNVDFDLGLTDEKFAQILDAIEQEFNSEMQSKLSELKSGERLKNHQIDEMYINAQLVIAREITDSYFDAEGLDKNTSNYDIYVRKTLESLHAYVPSEQSVVTTEEAPVSTDTPRTQLDRDTIGLAQKYLNAKITENLDYETQEKRRNSGDQTAELSDAERRSIIRDTEESALGNFLKITFSIDDRDPRSEVVVAEGADLLRQDIEDLAAVQLQEAKKLHTEAEDEIRKRVDKGDGSNPKGSDWHVARDIVWEEKLASIAESERDTYRALFKRFKSEAYEKRQAAKKARQGRDQVSHNRSGHNKPKSAARQAIDDNAARTAIEA